MLSPLPLLHPLLSIVLQLVLPHLRLGPRPHLPFPYHLILHDLGPVSVALTSMMDLFAPIFAALYVANTDPQLLSAPPPTPE